MDCTAPLNASCSQRTPWQSLHTIEWNYARKVALHDPARGSPSQTGTEKSAILCKLTRGSKEALPRRRSRVVLRHVPRARLTELQVYKIQLYAPFLNPSCSQRPQLQSLQVILHGKTHSVHTISTHPNLHLHGISMWLLSIAILYDHFYEHIDSGYSNGTFARFFLEIL